MQRAIASHYGKDKVMAVADLRRQEGDGMAILWGTLMALSGRFLLASAA
jgi:hypothetical protein